MRARARIRLETCAKTPASDEIRHCRSGNLSPVPADPSGTDSGSPSLGVPLCSRHTANRIQPAESIAALLEEIAGIKGTVPVNWFAEEERRR